MNLKRKEKKKICFRVCINVTANIDYLSIIVTRVRRIRIVRCIEVERWKNSDRRLLDALPLLVEKCDYARCVACNIVTNANYRANRK